MDMNGPLAAAHGFVSPSPVAGEVQVTRCDPRGLAEHWPFVRTGLMRIKNKHAQLSKWEPAHVRAAILDNRAELWLLTRTGPPFAFLVTTMQADPFLNTITTLFVWFAVSTAGGVDEGQAFLEQLARDRCVDSIECLTARNGLPRRMAKHGWKVAMTILRKELD